MTTLEDLYYGNISPHERYIKRGTRVDKLVKLICKNEDELTAGLTEKQKETFEKFKACQDELSGLTEREAFTDGCNIARMEVFHCHAPLFSFCPVPGVAAIIQRRCETALLFGRVHAPVPPQRKFPHKSPAPKAGCP